MDKHKMNYLAIILAFCTVIAGLGGFWLGTYFGEKDEVKDKTTETTTDNNSGEKEENGKENQISDEELEKITQELAKKIPPEKIYNIKNIDSAENRIHLILRLLGPWEVFDNGEVQSFYHKSRSEFVKKYEEVFGTKYSFEEDLKDPNVNFACDEIPELTGNDCTNSMDDDGEGYNSCEIEAEYSVLNVEDSTDEYIIFGKIVYDDDCDAKTDKKDFKLTFKKQGNEKYLSQVYVEN